MSRHSRNGGCTAARPPGISGDTRAALSDKSERDFEVRCICFRDSGFDRDLRAQTTLESGRHSSQFRRRRIPASLRAAASRLKLC